DDEAKTIAVHGEAPGDQVLVRHGLRQSVAVGVDLNQLSSGHQLLQTGIQLSASFAVQAEFADELFESGGTFGLAGNVIQDGGVREHGLSATSIPRERKWDSSGSSTTCPRLHAAAMLPASDAASRSAPRGNCCARPSARAQPRVFPRPVYLLCENFRSAAAFLPEMNWPKSRNPPANWQSVSSDAPIPVHPRAQRAGSSRQHARDTPASHRECGGVRSPSSNSCGRQVVRWSGEILLSGARPALQEDLRRRRADRHENLCRG